MKKKSITFILVITILLSFLPVIFMGAAASVRQYNYVKKNIMEIQQTAISHYLEQVDTVLENIDMYVLSLLSDNKWGDLMLGTGNTRYELRSVELLQTLRSKTAERGTVHINAIGSRIKNTDEHVWVYSGISYQESLPVREYEKSMPIQKWTLAEIEGNFYLCEKYESSVMEIGVLVNIDDVAEVWNETSTLQMTLGTEESNSNSNMSFYLRNGNVPFSVQIPQEYIQSIMPASLFVLFLTILYWILIMIFLLYWMRRKIAKPLKSMVETIDKIKNGEKDLRIEEEENVLETVILRDSINEFVDQIYNLEIQQYKNEIETQKTQLMNFQLQINPHMLLNALNTIYGLAEIEEYKNIQCFTLNLVKYLRYSFKNIDTMVTIAQELEFIKSYTEIQKIRYPDSFYILYNVEDELLNAYIPPFIIQNFVENSIKYAQGKKSVEILVIIKKAEDKLRISVCDDGIGIDKEILKELNKEKYYEKNGETHIGIYNCIRRLRLSYGKAMQFSITSEPNEGTQIWMEFPYRRDA